MLYNRTVISCLTILFLIQILAGPVFAQQNQNKKPKIPSQETTKLQQTSNYFIRLSVDNNFKSSQTAHADIFASVISLGAYTYEKLELDNTLFTSIISRLGFLYVYTLVATANHEISGHATRVHEFGGTVTNTVVDFDGSGYVTHTPSNPYHLQKEVLISAGGFQASCVLSQKLMHNLIFHDQQLDPITSIGYLIPSIDQFGYILSMKTSEKNSDGHDVNAYLKDTERMYGKNAISAKTIKKYAWLDILNPFLFASIYSSVTGYKTDIPMIKIHNIGVTPFASLVVTPYGTLEKKISSYIFTPYTPIKIGFSFGKQSKTPDSYEYTSDDLDNFKDLAGTNDIRTLGVFTGLKPGEEVKNYSSYAIDISILKLLTLGDFIIGMDAVLWKQPKLFTANTYFEKPKMGGMITINGQYQIFENFALFSQLGYKTQGFVVGQYLEKTPIISVGIEVKL